MLPRHSLSVNSVFLSFCRDSTGAALISADDWNRESHPMKKDPFGVFEVVVPAKDGQPAIPHNSKIKVSPSTLRLMLYLTG
jgi:1,4-alpha-glucan branching enzyme